MEIHVIITKILIYKMKIQYARIIQSINMFESNNKFINYEKESRRIFVINLLSTISILLNLQKTNYRFIH